MGIGFLTFVGNSFSQQTAFSSGSCNLSNPTSSMIPELLVRLCLDIFDGAEHHIDSCSKWFGLFLLSVMVYICGKSYFFDKVQEQYFSVI